MVMPTGSQSLRQADDAVAGVHRGAAGSFAGVRGAGQRPPVNKSCLAERRLLGRMLEALGNPPLRLVLWDGEEVAGALAATVRVRILDRGALLRLVADPELHFGELYVAGRIEIPGDLAEAIEIIYRALPQQRLPGIREKLVAAFVGAADNAPPKAASNIHHHYDIGNDFYKLWLDERLVYTCAYYADPAASLEAAQLAKLEYVCRKLRLRPGETVVEAGCGWGALALHMARHHGVTVKAYNLSPQQIAYARERADAEGLRQQVDFIEADYREIRGRFDAFVSVGMLEHVGTAGYGELGALIDRCLAADGRGLIHSIGRDYPHGMNPWITRHIFPGACPPALSQMMAVFEPNGFSVLDIENLRLHYARTLEHWQERFERAAGTVTAMFDEAFVRAWRLYLAGSLAAFRSGDMQLFQVCFARSGCNRIPWSRRDLYAAGGDDGIL